MKFMFKSRQCNMLIWRHVYKIKFSFSKHCFSWVNGKTPVSLESDASLAYLIGDIIENTRWKEGKKYKQWCVTKYLTTSSLGKKKGLICLIFPLPWCKKPQHATLQPAGRCPLAWSWTELHTSAVTSQCKLVPTQYRAQSSSALNILWRITHLPWTTHGRPDNEDVILLSGQVTIRTNTGQIDSLSQESESWVGHKYRTKAWEKSLTVLAL